MPKTATEGEYYVLAVSGKNVVIGESRRVVKIH